MRIFNPAKSSFLSMAASVAIPYFVAMNSLTMNETFHVTSDGLVWTLRILLLCPLLGGPALAAIISHSDSQEIRRGGLIGESLLAVPIAYLAYGLVLKAIWADQYASYGRTILYGGWVFVWVFVFYLTYPAIYFYSRKIFLGWMWEAGPLRIFPKIWALSCVGALVLAVLPLIFMEMSGQRKLRNREQLYAEHIRYDKEGLTIAQRLSWPLQPIPKANKKMIFRKDPFDFEGWPSFVVEQDRGRLLVAGRFERYAMRKANRMVRLLPTGALDPTFQPLEESPCLYHIGPVFPCPGGLLYILGKPNSNNHYENWKLIKILSDGKQDPGFNWFWKNTVETSFWNISDVEVQPDGQIIVLGSTDHGRTHGKVLRFDLENKIDQSFTNNLHDAVENAAGPWGGVGSIKSLSSGKLLLHIHPSRELEKYTLFGAGPMVVVDKEGKLVKKFFPAFSTDYYVDDTNILWANKADRIIRLDADGEVMDTFFIPRGLDRFRTVAFRNGTVLYGTGVSSDWDLQTYGFPSDAALACFTREGTLDDSFLANKPGNFILGQVERIFVQRDGRIIVLGGFSMEQEHDLSFKRSIVRLNENGMIDPTFDPGALPKVN